MKHVIVLAILAVTIPLVAAESREAKPASTPATTVQQPDSPLVAAAKRAGRLNKKPTFVITNETLAHMNSGRLSVANEAIGSIPPLPPAPQASTEAQLQQQKVQLQQMTDKLAAEQKRLEQARVARTQARASQYEEDYLDADPAAAEHAMDQMTTSKSSERPTSKPSERPPQN